MKHFYNDNEPTVYAWLCRLVAAGHLPAGDVNPAPVQLLTPALLAGYTSAHFFAGIGGWPLALRMAGWPEDEPVWTASLPCQPFSNAGKRQGVNDERHLWPVFRHLVAECRPPIIFGEQVASRAGREWLAGVRADLEALGYAVGAADLCAAGVGAPHIRQRLFWVAALPGEGMDYAHGARRDRAVEGAEGDPRDETRLRVSGERRDDGRVAHAEHTERREVCVYREDGCDGPDGGRQEAHSELRARGEIRGLADAERRTAKRHGHEMAGGSRGLREEARKQRFRHDAGHGDATDRVAHADQPGRGPRGETTETARYRRSFGPESWAGADWLLCLDGKWRRIPAEPELFPLADGLPGRVGQLRAYGNAIVPQVAATFVRAFVEARQ